MFDSRIAMLAVGTWTVAIIAGAVTGSLGTWVYLLVISPGLAAIGCGMTAHSMVGALGITSPRTAGAVGAIGGALVLLTILVVNQQMLRANYVSELSGAAGLGDETIERVVAERMALLTDGASDTTAPIALRVHSGVKLFGQTVLDLGEPINAVLLFLELAGCLYLGWRIPSERANELWCDPCKHWYSRRMVATCALGVKETAQAELQNQRYHRLARRMNRATTRNKEPVVLHAWMCDTCDDGIVRFELEVTQPGKRSVVIKRQDAPHSALDAVLDSQTLMDGA